MIIQIPFQGFYCSVHDNTMDYTLEQAFSDHDTGCDVNERLLERAHDAVDWTKAHIEYAKLYVEGFWREFDIRMQFESLQSPREYNFETDRIFVHMIIEDLMKLWSDLDKEEFTKTCAQRFTSRDGFSSFYDPDWTTWGEVKDWDHNQLGTIIQCHAAIHDHYCEADFLMDSAQSNGLIGELLFNTPEMNRLGEIHDYLNERVAR